jgi:hypothetical protein
MTTADTLPSADFETRRREAIEALLGDGWQQLHPYSKWSGAHWRLVTLVDLEAPIVSTMNEMFELVLDWLAGHHEETRQVSGRWRQHTSQEGNALIVGSYIGRADDQRMRTMASDLVLWQWPDGGWNCVGNPKATHSSFHESVTPIRGLTAFARVTGDKDALAAARRGAEMLLVHQLYRSERSGRPIRPEWTDTHWPPYWHYDYFQGLRALSALGLLQRPEAADALDLLESQRRSDGSWAASGRRYWRMSGRSGREVVSWAGFDHQVITRQAGAILENAGR